MKQSIKKARRTRSQEKEQRYNCPSCAEVIRFIPLERLGCRSCREVAVFGKEHPCFCSSIVIGLLLICGMVVLLLVLKSSTFQINDVILQSSVIGCAIGLAVLTMLVLFFLISEVLLKVVESVEVIGSSRVPGGPLPAPGGQRRERREIKEVVVE
jgi:hypothetical protein